MGGLGSGQRWSRRRTVEQCLTVTVWGMARAGRLRAGAGGAWQWTRDGKPYAAISWATERRGSGLALVLRYRATVDGEGRDVVEPLPLEDEAAGFGGRRWWLRCPLPGGGAGCGRRVAKVHLPPRSLRFGCRMCHRLTYRSVQAHDARLDRLRADPQLLYATMDGPWPGRLLACHAGLRGPLNTAASRARWQRWHVEQERERSCLPPLDWDAGESHGPLPPAPCQSHAGPPHGGIGGETEQGAPRPRA